MTMPNHGCLLVVDDNELNRDMLSRRLRRHGYDADVAIDGQAALDSIARREYDLVLLDIEMPGMTGLDVLLVEVAQRLTLLAPEASLVARVAADEYVFALEGVSAKEAADFAERVLSSLQQPFQIVGQQISLSASIGVAVDDSGRPAEEV